jgi:TolB-like protein
MGEVYRARDSRLKRDVALKVLPGEFATDRERLARFQREAEVLAALNHPNIAQIYGLEGPALVMELVEGTPLSDSITPGGMPVARFLDLAVPLAEALTAAHQKRVTHRDLKPGNIMVGVDGRVKVLDFGLARVGADHVGQPALTATQGTKTQDGMVVGTLPYMSPEQVEGRPVDTRSDLFSLGVIFYEMLCGERPFKGDSPPALMSAILRDTPAAIVSTRPAVPAALERLVFRLLEKRPDDRMQTARDVLNELRHLRRETESASTPSAASVPTMRSTVMRVAVLPFAVRGGSDDAAMLASGLTEDVASSLARFPGLSVVAAQSTRAFKDSELDVRRIAECIGARYIVSGTVRQAAGGAIRVTAHLIDAASGAQMWAHDYTRDTQAADVFAIQDDLTDHIVATVADPYGLLARSMVQTVEASGGIGDAPTPELLVRTWGFQQLPLPEVHAALRDRLEAAVESGPGNADLWADLAHTYVVEHQLCYNPRPDPLRRALRAARRAVEIDRNHQNGWLWQAVAQFYLRDREGVEDAGQRAIRINPRNATVMAWVGNILTHMGEYDRGCALTERAMTLNPAHPGWLHFATFNRHFGRGEYEQALLAARRSNLPQFFWMHLAIAAAAGHAGRVMEGGEAAEQMMALAPFLADEGRLREFVARWYWDGNVLERLLEGIALSKAAGPERQA